MAGGRVWFGGHRASIQGGEPGAETCRRDGCPGHVHLVLYQFRTVRLPPKRLVSSHVGGWATLGSVTPAAGCWLDASIEVREAGGGVGDVAVGVNLVHGGEVVWADWGMTDADGLAYLSVDTSWAAPGYEAWMDVLVGGEYAGGMPRLDHRQRWLRRQSRHGRAECRRRGSPGEWHGAKLEHVRRAGFGRGAGGGAHVRTATQSKLRVRRAGDGHGRLRHVGLGVRVRPSGRLVREPSLGLPR